MHTEHLRQFTLAESLRLIQLGCQIERETDAALGKLICRLAGGDDSTLPEIHDRCNVIGRHDIADKIRKFLRVGE